MTSPERPLGTIALVTGATGFLGQSLVRRLVGQGAVVRCLLRATSSAEPLLASLSPDERPRIQIVRFHGRTSDLAAALEGCSVVYHVAAALRGSAAVLCRANVSFTRQLFAAALATPIKRIVLVSSMGVYATEALPAGGTLDEGCSLDPHPERRDSYTLSKILQERLAWEAHEDHDLPVVVVRPGVIYGPGREIPVTRLGLPIGRWILWVVGRRAMPYCYVENCADGVALAGLVEGIEGQAFNLIDDESPSATEIFETNRRMGLRFRRLPITYSLMLALAALLSRWHEHSRGQVPLVLTPYRVQAIWKRLNYPNDKAKRTLSWSPKVSTAVALEATLRHALARVSQ